LTHSVISSNEYTMDVLKIQYSAAEADYVFLYISSFSQYAVDVFVDFHSLLTLAA